MRPLTPHTKKLVGTILTLIWLPIYAMLAMGVGVRILPNAGWFVEFLYYAIAGTIWIVPVGLMLPWMYRDPANHSADAGAGAGDGANTSETG